MKISLNDEWQALVEEHEQAAQHRKTASARQNTFLLCALALVLLTVVALFAIYLLKLRA